MQRVNQAYDANDLLTLLGLQLEIEQIDTAHLSSTTAERLAHYNQILKEQLARLEAELESFIEPYRELMGGWSGQCERRGSSPRTRSQLKLSSASSRITAMACLCAQPFGELAGEREIPAGSEWVSRSRCRVPAPLSHFAR
jgi:hypothetical protein